MSGALTRHRLAVKARMRNLVFYSRLIFWTVFLGLVAYFLVAYVPAVTRHVQAPFVWAKNVWNHTTATTLMPPKPPAPSRREPPTETKTAEAPSSALLGSLASLIPQTTPPPSQAPPGPPTFDAEKIARKAHDILHSDWQTVQELGGMFKQAYREMTGKTALSAQEEQAVRRAYKKLYGIELRDDQRQLMKSRS